MTSNELLHRVIYSGGLNGQKNSYGVANYRIPSLLKTCDGTLIAGTDQRHNHQWDWGNIDIVVRRSSDEGKTWGSIITLIDLPTNPLASQKDADSAFNIDMNLVQNPQTKRIFSIFGMFPEGRGVFRYREGEGELRDQFVSIDGTKYLALYKPTDPAHPYTLRENGVVYDYSGNKTDYTVTVHSNQPPYSDLGNIYLNNELIGNIYFSTHSSSPFEISNRNYLWITYSDDDGKSWSCPKDITSQVKKDWMHFYGVSPGNAIVLHSGPKKGRIVFPAYSTNHPTDINRSQSTHVFYSDDNGETWFSSEAINDNRVLDSGEVIHASTMSNTEAQNTEATLVQLNNGDLKIFMRNLTGYVQVATSKDAGETWENTVESIDEIKDVYCQLSAIQFNYKNHEYVLLANAQGPQRTNGHVHLGEVQSDGSFKWLNHKLIQTGKYAYNALQQINEDHFGLLYEHSQDPYNEYQIHFKAFDFNWLLKD